MYELHFIIMSPFLTCHGKAIPIEVKKSGVYERDGARTNKATWWEACGGTGWGGRLEHRPNAHGSRQYRLQLGCFSGGSAFGGDHWAPTLDGNPNNDREGVGWMQVGDPARLGKNHREAHGGDAPGKLTSERVLGEVPTLDGAGRGGSCIGANASCACTAKQKLA